MRRRSCSRASADARWRLLPSGFPRRLERHETRLQLQRLSAVLDRGDDPPRSRRIGYRGIELLADVPHAWPAGLLPERVESIRRSLDDAGLTISNINAFMMNAVADPRQPYWHPGLDRSRSALPGHPPRAHQAGAAAGPASSGRRTSPPSRAARWPTARRAAQAHDIFYDELMPCVEVAEKLGVGLLIEPEPELLIERFDQYLRVRRADRLAAGRPELRRRPRLLRRRGSAGLGRPDGRAHGALPLRGHRRDARPPAPGPRPRGDRLRRHAAGDSQRPATTAGSRSSCIPISTRRTTRPARPASSSPALAELGVTERAAS